MMWSEHSGQSEYRAVNYRETQLRLEVGEQVRDLARTNVQWK